MVGDVGQDQYASGPKDAEHFVQGTCPVGGARQVMQDPMRHDGIKAAGRGRQRGGISGDDIHPCFRAPTACIYECAASAIEKSFCFFFQKEALPSSYAGILNRCDVNAATMAGGAAPKGSSEVTPFGKAAIAAWKFGQAVAGSLFDRLP